MADVSELAIGQHLRAGDLKLAENVKLETDKGVVIAHVIPPRKPEEEEAEAAPAEGAAAEAAEPEVVKRGKVEEAEDEGSKE